MTGTDERSASPRFGATGGLELDQRQLRWLLVATSAYVAASLMANVMSARIVRVGPSWLTFAIDAGTLTYPLTFTLRDVVHKIGGRRTARVVIVATAALNVLLALGLWATAALPGDPAVTSPAQEWFGPVLNPVLRITLGSIVAQVIAELLDTEVYHRYVQRFGHRAQWGRVLFSNAVSIPVDSIVFVAIAFGGTLPFAVAVSIVWANVVVKGAASVLTTPLIYAVPEHLSRPPVD
ncbi:MAG: queuosine precursor transporter [Actinomycetes bacterium]